MFAHIDVMQEYGFEWDYTPGAQPRLTTPELRLADLIAMDSMPRLSMAVS